MKKKFVLDTNVLLANPNAILSFDDNDVYIPISVIEEMDTFKKGMSETGRNARHFSRILDDLRSRGSLSTGIKLFPDRPDSGSIFVTLDSDMSLLPSWFERKPDNLILSVALILKNKETAPDRPPVVLITKDSNLRIKADAIGIPVEDYEADKVNIDELYTGIAEFEVEGSMLKQYLASGAVPMDGFELMPNQYVILRDLKDPVQFVYGKFDHVTNSLRTLNLGGKDFVWGIYPRNLEQSFALDLLLDDDVKLVTLVGSAGTGKTLLAIAAGLEKTTDEAKYQKLLVSRPIFPLGRDVGFLPGTLEEKLNPWMQPIFDNLELLLGGHTQGRNKRLSQSYHELISQGILEVEPLTYIRGRSIPNQYFIVDEAQNLTPHEIKTILTRAGENTKVILTGDPYQIDNPYVDAASNGLTYVVERMRREAIAGHITLVKGERSALATIAANLL
ncbi:MAG: PhoH family protein [Silvanigrellales bacterium]|nr:PhoH family protein [Silvanigrellales bacterium]